MFARLGQAGVCGEWGGGGLGNGKGVVGAQACGGDQRHQTKWCTNARVGVNTAVMSQPLSTGEAEHTNEHHQRPRTSPYKGME